MSAPTQVAANKKFDPLVAHPNDEGIYYFDLGGIYLFVGSGSPDGEVTGVKGSLFIDIDTPAIYQCEADGTGWSVVTQTT